MSEAAPDLPTVVVLMGVSGVGKTTVGRVLADRLGWSFVDADDLHPPANVAKMGRGEALSDEDRAPWLRAVRASVARCLATGRPTVLACSALKTAYRTYLRVNGRVRFVWLDVPHATLEARLFARPDHFAGLDLLPSQLVTLEPPSEREAVHVEAEADVSETADRVMAALGLGPHVAPGC